MSRRYIYFIKPVGLDGPVKIGSSKCPETRLLKLSVWSPFPLEILGTIPGSVSDETYLHSCFAFCHSHREWFHSTPSLHEAIKSILSEGMVFARANLPVVGRIRNDPPRSPQSVQRSIDTRKAVRALRSRQAAVRGSFHAA